MRTILRQLVVAGLSVLIAGALYGCEIEGPPAVAPEPFEPTEVEPYTPPPPEGQPRSVVILHTNDEHSHLLGFGPNSEYPFLPAFTDGEVDEVATLTRIASVLATGEDTRTVGGLVRRQYLVNEIRAESLDPVLLLSAGDSMMGTLFALAAGDAAPDLVGMGMLGYDFMTLGNHAFDLGPGLLAKAISVADTTLFGAGVPIVSSNMHFDDVAEDDAGARALAALYGEGDSGAPIMPWATKLLANGLRVGFMGMLGYDAALVAPGRGDIHFSVPTTGSACLLGGDCTGAEAGFSCVRGHCVDPLDHLDHLEAAAAEAQAVVDHLRQVEKVDLVICISHQGAAEDAYLAGATSGIDVIIGGHSHDEVAPMPIGDTVIVQAGAYGNKLGRLVVTVQPDGSVTYDQAASGLLPVDRTLDAEILGDTDLTAQPPVISEELRTAVGLTAGLIGPVLAGLDASIAPMIDPLFPDRTITSVLDWAASGHDVIGGLPSQESNLGQLVTDALFSFARRENVAGAFEPLVAVEANGVLRDSLLFGKPEPNGEPTTSIADVFRVLPLGASPTEAVPAPGYSLVVFWLHPFDFYAGIDLGVTYGLESDSFFLNYSGVKVTYDPTLPPFDPLTFEATSPEPQGRVTKIEMYFGEAWRTVFHQDPADTTTAFADRWTEIDLGSQRIMVVTNYYLANFLAAFGLTPLEYGTRDPIAPGELFETVLCWIGPQPQLCRSYGTVPWELPEVKEWYVLLRYMVLPPPDGLGAQLGFDQYGGETPEAPRITAAPYAP